MNKEIIAYDINGYPLHENDIIYMQGLFDELSK